jgi:hypothetical protein
MKRKSLFLFLILVLLAACGTPAGGQPATPTLAPTETPVPSPTPFPSPTVAPTAVPGVLYVDPSLDLGAISPYIYGTNYGPANAVPLEMMPLVMDAGFTALRFPGGRWGDSVDLQPFQIDQFVTFYTQVGTLPTISVRLIGGTPEKAAELVRYTNIEKDYGVVYWSIGNEPTIYRELNQVDYDYTTEIFNRDWRAIALAMKAVDPTIKLMGPELHGTFTSNFATNPKDAAGRDWMTEFLKANGDLVDVVTYHRYPFPHDGHNATISTLRQDPPEWTATIYYLRALIREITGRDLPIGVTEVGSDSSAVMVGEASPDSFYSAIWYADVLGRMAQQRVFMVNQWVLSQRSTGLGLIHGTDIRPTYYTFLMYKNFGSELLYASSGVADVTVYAAERNDGALTLMVINLSDTEQRVPLQIQDLTLSKAEVWLFDAAHNAENLGEQTLPADGILTLPAQSVTLYVIGK